MTGMLASVNSLAEARLVLAEKADIIDLKEPALGALGAVAIPLAREIVMAVDGQCPISATIGDLPMQPELISDAVRKMAETGVDYIKIGFFPGGKPMQVIRSLAPLCADNQLIAVLFAEENPDYSLIKYFKNAGFAGVMLDSADKTKGSLTALLAQSEIEDFVRQVKSARVLCGLAGSLQLADIPLLTPYQPDYLGFRGALCGNHNRAGQIDNRAVRQLKQAIIRHSH